MQQALIEHDDDDDDDDDDDSDYNCINCGNYYTFFFLLLLQFLLQSKLFRMWTVSRVATSSLRAHSRTDDADTRAPVAYRHISMSVSQGAGSLRETGRE